MGIFIEKNILDIFIEKIAFLVPELIEAKQYIYSLVSYVIIS